MDPNACLKAIDNAMNVIDDSSPFEEHCRNLYQWLRSGGFLPNIGMIIH